MSVRLQPLLGDAIRPYIPALAELRMRIFCEYPYLYQGSVEYEQNYLKDYANQATNLCVIATDGEQVVGASTAMWLRHTAPAFQHCFSGSPCNTAAIFYFGESVLLPEYRGRKIGHAFFDHREQHARLCGAETAAFCAIERPNRPQPESYRPLDGFWHKRGFTRNPDLAVNYRWKEVGESIETDHKLVFWTKDL